MRMIVLIVDDEPHARYAMAKAIRTSDREILEAENGAVALSMIRERTPDLVFLDLNMPIMDGLSLLTELNREKLPIRPEIIVVTANDSVASAVGCIRQGASDFIVKPYDIEHLRAITRRSEERVALQAKIAKYQSQLESTPGFGSIIGISRPMQSLFRQIEKAGQSSLPVLIRGESGTGKELVARQLHESGPRASKLFVAVNTAAIAESLVESELFGHVKGAYTGADHAREGVFRQANGGTLFLDEIGDMPPSVQTRLLRVLQEGIVQSVGSEQNFLVDVRVISATHQDLAHAISEKLFRQDLYYRLCGIELFLPPLRARHEDILLLASEFATTGGVQAIDGSFTPDAITAIMRHQWPGNVRELKQRVQAASAMAEGSQITAADLRLNIEEKSSADGTPFEKYLELPLSVAKNQLVADFERHAIEQAIQVEGGNVSAAARRLGIHRQSLQLKIKQLSIRGKE